MSNGNPTIATITEHTTINTVELTMDPDLATKYITKLTIKARQVRKILPTKHIKNL